MSNKVISGCTFHHIALQTSNFEKSLKFYTEGLGFEVFRTFTASTGKKVALIDIGEGSYFELFSDGEVKENKLTELLVMQEEVKTLPFGDIWAEYCARQGVAADKAWFEEVQKYEQEVLLNR